LALDSHIERHLDWLLRATEEVGQSPMRSDAATKDTRVAELVHPPLPRRSGRSSCSPSRRASSTA